MEQTKSFYMDWRQMLRLIMALYVMLLAMGAVDYPAGIMLVAVIFPAKMASAAFAIGLFAGAYFILVGQNLRRASAGLLAFFVLARLYAPSQGFDPAVLREMILVAALLMTGGWFAQKKHTHIDAPGRIRLTRVALQTKAAASKKRCHALQQSPDEMTRLFDQLQEIG